MYLGFKCFNYKHLKPNFLNKRGKYNCYFIGIAIALLFTTSLTKDTLKLCIIAAIFGYHAYKTNKYIDETYDLEIESIRRQNDKSN